MNKTYYDILQVSASANIAVIQASYRALAKLYHPDLNKDPSATMLFQEIQEAYETLSDSAKRAEYDSTINVNNPIEDAKNNDDDTDVHQSGSFNFNEILHFIYLALKKSDISFLFLDLIANQPIGNITISRLKTPFLQIDIQVKAICFEPDDIRFFNNYKPSPLLLRDTVFVKHTARDYKSITITLIFKQNEAFAIRQSNALCRCIDAISRYEMGNGKVSIGINHIENQASNKEHEYTAKYANTQNTSNNNSSKPEHRDTPSTSTKSTNNNPTDSHSNFVFSRNNIILLSLILLAAFLSFVLYTVEPLAYTVSAIALYILLRFFIWLFLLLRIIK